MKLVFVLIAATQLGNAEPLPLFFLPKVDNSDPIRFGAQSSDLHVGFARDFVALRSAGMQVKMRFVDASASATLAGVDALSARANIFEGRSADDLARGDPHLPKGRVSRVVPRYRLVLWRGWGSNQIGVSA